ncbi:unnamed protein product [Protopolystoma xenopodis]|uniref:Uncharacterized protein n=1 Tax=Protopolystoma xenopodis TaxID=117903 RepID=A0A448WVY1_9PLAT|nr:unnamed protein product [Protopolystoma xenopodis]
MDSTTMKSAGFDLTPIGTTWKATFELLYHQPCHHFYLPSRRERGLKPEARLRVDQLLLQETKSQLPPKKTKTICTGYAAVVGVPSSAYFRYLLKVFLKAKVTTT